VVFNQAKEGPTRYHSKQKINVDILMVLAALGSPQYLVIGWKVLY